MIRKRFVLLLAVVAALLAASSGQITGAASITAHRDRYQLSVTAPCDRTITTCAGSAAVRATGSSTSTQAVSVGHGRRTRNVRGSAQTRLRARSRPLPARSAGSRRRRPPTPKPHRGSLVARFRPGLARASSRPPKPRAASTVRATARSSGHLGQFPAVRYTTGATNITKHQDGSMSAQLNAIDSCYGGSARTACTVFVRWRARGARAWTDAPSVKVTSIERNARWQQTASGLVPKARYDYQVCGKEASFGHVLCAGPAGTASGTSTFTADPGSSDWPQYGYEPGHSAYNPFETTINTSNVTGLTRVGNDDPTCVGCDWSSPTVINSEVFVGSTVGAVRAGAGVLHLLLTKQHHRQFLRLHARGRQRSLVRHRLRRVVRVRQLL